jgi:iron-sulfur cluster assembly accessory protein
MITVTEFAANKIKGLIAEDSDAKGLRIFVKGGGCSGYSYGMLLEEKVTEDDTVIEKDGIQVIVDPQSLPLIQDSVVDYSDSLMGAGFQIKNPQAVTKCGCGSSFGT